MSQFTRLHHDVESAVRYYGIETLFVLAALVLGIFAITILDGEARLGCLKVAFAFPIFGLAVSFARDIIEKADKE